MEWMFLPRRHGQRMATPLSDGGRRDKGGGGVLLRLCITCMHRVFAMHYGCFTNAA